MSFGFDNTSKENNFESKFENKYIIVKTENDFFQKGKITNLDLTEDERHIVLTFTNESGEASTKKIFIQPSTGEGEKYDKSVEIFQQHLMNIGRRYKGENYTVFASTLLDLAKAVIRDVKPLLSKTIFCKMELVEKDNKIYTNIASFAPLADDTKKMYISKAQKELLAKKNSFKPDVDTKLSSNSDFDSGEFNNASYSMPDAPVTDDNLPF